MEQVSSDQFISVSLFDGKYLGTWIQNHGLWTKGLQHGGNRLQIIFDNNKSSNSHLVSVAFGRRPKIAIIIGKNMVNKVRSCVIPYTKVIVSALTWRKWAYSRMSTN